MDTLAYDMLCNTMTLNYTYDANGNCLFYGFANNTSGSSYIYKASTKIAYPLVYTNGSSLLFGLFGASDTAFGTSELVSFTAANGDVTTYNYTHNSSGCMSAYTETKNGTTTNYTVEY